MRVPGVILEGPRSRAKPLAVIGTHDPSGGVLNIAEGAIDIRGQTVSANFVEFSGLSRALWLTRHFLLDGVENFEKCNGNLLPKLPGVKGALWILIEDLRLRLYSCNC